MYSLSQIAARLLVVIIIISVVATAILQNKLRSKTGPATVYSGQQSCLLAAMYRIKSSFDFTAAYPGKSKIEIREGIDSDTLILISDRKVVSYFVGQGENRGILIESVAGKEIPVCATIYSLRCRQVSQDSINIRLTATDSDDDGQIGQIRQENFASFNFNLK